MGRMGYPARRALATLASLASVLLLASPAGAERTRGVLRRAAPTARTPAQVSAHQDIRLSGHVTSSVTLRVSLEEAPASDAALAGRPPRAATSGATAPAQAHLRVELHQTGVACSKVVARLGAAPDGARVRLDGGNHGSLELDGEPRLFATVLVSRVVMPAVLTLWPPAGAPPGDTTATALFEATDCSE